LNHVSLKRAAAGTIRSRRPATTARPGK
jgi:hypothetical protein